MDDFHVDRSTTCKASPGKTDKKYSPNAPSSTTGSADSETRASGGDPSGKNSFCTGWEAGYTKGWMKVHIEGTRPDEVPTCPETVPTGCEDYKCGFATGTKAGQIAAKKARG